MSQFDSTNLSTYIRRSTSGPYKFTFHPSVFVGTALERYRVSVERRFSWWVEERYVLRIELKSGYTCAPNEAQIYSSWYTSPYECANKIIRILTEATLNATQLNEILAANVVRSYMGLDPL